MKCNGRSNCLPIFRACAGVSVSAASPRFAITNHCLVSVRALKTRLYAAPASAAELEREPLQMRDELWSFIVHRPCHRAGWAWANREEGYDPGALPGCLWPSPRKTERPYQGELIEKGDESYENEAWDAGDIACGDLVLELRMRLRAMKPGQVLRIKATDPGAREDIPAWCRLTGHKLLGAEHPQYWIERKED